MSEPTAVPRPADTACRSRRQVLHGAGALAGVVVGGGVLAACAEGTDPDRSADDVSTSAAGQAVVALEDVPVGGAVSAEVAGVPVLVTRPAEDEVHAFSAVCTHQGCTVTPGDGVLECPCHRSVFSLTDASVQSGPAPEPLGEIAVEISGADVVVS
ncbi:nitrite reductase/ring-hydroxylating ferredoxin subunit [Isoptericola sp. CG 20/1183]|uniref:Cytochrome bc1 complex Rieske iron-sulfur subunit n=1 Tax=Isoptericola halotolerans TaxID=300560 RepID=A0ABX5ECJ3_9MICO|nr:MULTISPECIES: Rieske (2Fe-2S) protein [Isoptericola]MCK0116587.1 Rieske (2Fe-2S) protein [Isoptericola sp. S6320L]PRZ05554.1 nitrite reductase/ring-hydroxylating ferredoxin subunit [Isoptericola halotolerans]PRZ06122.1 nitrite reductase/ring-hydroxylating ferredoxin subunit [Isoptericola sp. CG 20/1183]